MLEYFNNSTFERGMVFEGEEPMASNVVVLRHAFGAPASGVQSTGVQLQAGLSLGQS